MDDDGKEQRVLQQYVTAFIDLLGQSERLEQLDRILETSPANGDVGQLADDTYRHVRQIRAFLRQWCEQELPDVRDRDGKLWHPQPDSESEKPVYQWASDSLVVSVPIVLERPAKTLFEIYRVMRACGAACLKMLEEGCPIRGGLSIGYGLEVEKGEVLGAGVVRSHEIESKRARYPRILVDGRVMAAVESCGESTNDADGPPDGFPADLCVFCEEIAPADFDGWRMIDFLGPGARRGFTTDVFERLVTPARAFVAQQLEEESVRENRSVMEKYSWLRNYFIRRELWTS